MFEILVASGNTAAAERPWGARAASLIVHSALIATAIAATRHAAPPAVPERTVTTVFFPHPAPQTARPAPPAPAPPCGCTPSLPFTVEIPPMIPDPGAVPVDPGFNTWPTPGDTLGGAAPGVPGTPGLTSPAPIDARFAEEPPVLLGHPEARYPGLLREAGLEGRVVVEVVVDTLGRAEPRTLRIATSAHPLFDAEASAVVLGSRYRPGRVAGRPVRVRILVPVAFSLRR
jgi:TonB family protein